MKELRSGMLCLITGARRNFENVGKVVTLIEQIEYGRKRKSKSDQKITLIYKGTSGAWQVEGEGLSKTLIHANGDTEKVLWNELIVHPKHLMPIEGFEKAQEILKTNSKILEGNHNE